MRIATLERYHWAWVPSKTRHPRALRLAESVEPTTRALDKPAGENLLAGRLPFRQIMGYR
jgi:hypothetical protein